MFLPHTYTQIIIIKGQEGRVLIFKLTELCILNIQLFTCQAYLNKMVENKQTKHKSFKNFKNFTALWCQSSTGNILMLLFLETSMLAHTFDVQGEGGDFGKERVILILCPADTSAILAGGTLFMNSLPGLHPPFSFSLWVDMWIVWDTVRSPHFNQHTPWLILLSYLWRRKSNLMDISS